MNDTRTTTPQTLRGISRSARGMATSDGAGVKLTRVIGTPLMPRIDPFLMLDEFRNDDPRDYQAGFPDHPHRGFETITYMLAGKFRHKDNKGHEGLLETGGAQWMTAGRGIVHSEMPEQTEGLSWGFQLWLNLPAAEKMRDAEYRDLQPWDIPVAKLPGGAEVRVLGGRIGDVVGPVSGRKTEPVFFDATLPAGGSVTLPLPAGHAGFIYPFEGSVRVPGGKVPRDLVRGELGLLADGGDVVSIEALKGPARVILGAGRPLGEPIAQHGPFVMNTVEQLEQAIKDFRAGKF